MTGNPEVIVSFARFGRLDGPVALQSPATGPRSDSLGENRSDESAWCCLIFPPGISRKREVVGHGSMDESNCSTLPTLCGLHQRSTDLGARILCQPSLIGSHHMTAHIPFQKRRSVNNVLLTFSTCIRRPFCARLGKGHSRLTRSEQIGSAGTSTSRNWTIGFGPKSHVRPCALSTWRASEWTNWIRSLWVRDTFWIAQDGRFCAQGRCWGTTAKKILHSELDAAMLSRINSNRDRCQNSRSK